MNEPGGVRDKPIIIPTVTVGEGDPKPVEEEVAELSDPNTIRSGDIRQPRNTGDVDRVAMLAVHEAGGGKIGVFDVVPGRWADVVGIDKLAAFKKDEVGAGLTHMFAQFEGATGVKIPDDVKKAILADPASLTDHLDQLALSPRQLTEGLKLMIGAQQARGEGAGDLGKKYYIDGDHFDLSQIDQVDVKLPDYELARLAPGIYQGDKPGKLLPAQMRKNQVLAEVFERLAENETLQEGEARFGVTLAGETVHGVPELMKALRDHGYDVKVRFGHRIANFANVKTKGHEEPNQAARHVPLALPINTEVTNDAGQTAILPAVHAEMVVSIGGGDGTGPNLDGGIRFFQGMSKTGFFAAGQTERHEWLGWKETAVDGHVELTGAKADRALELAALLTDLINEVAKELDLPNAGYGYLGWCLDTVQYVLSGVGGPLTYYPLGGNDEALRPAIEKAIAGNPRFAPLLPIIEAVPTDGTPEGKKTELERMKASIPSDRDSDVFVYTDISRQIIDEAIAKQQNG